MVDFSDLDDTNLNQGGVAKPKKDRPTFPCMSCAGTGKYCSPRVHQEKAHCFACAGKGFFYTDPHKRAANKAKRADKKQQAITFAREALEEQRPGLWDIIVHASSKSTIMESFRNQILEGRHLSEKQVAVVLKWADREEGFKMAREAAKAQRVADVDLSPVHAMFDHARDAGLKKLSYRAEGLVIKPASATGANAGALYVKTVSGDYVGKIKDLKFFGNRDAKPEHVAALNTIAANPVEAAKAYGKLTGKCSCCGRTLTDPQSIELGIGPICQDNWFGGATKGPTKAEVRAQLAEAAVTINTNYTKATRAAGQYDHLYTPGMTADEKKRIRAQARRQR